MKTLILAACVLGLAVRCRAGLLAEFSCQRPKPLDPGSWQNVSLAASAVDKLVVKPGEIFSFLQAITPVQAGFVPGRSLSGGSVVMSKGGGYCQVSTALYNAAVLAGLPVVERYSHSFYDSAEAYVEPGRDAAVSGSTRADFRFENPSAVPLTLSASADDGKVTIRIFGALRPKKRWLKLAAKRVPHNTLDQDSAQAEGTLLRPGFDGWEVTKELQSLDSQGNTKSTSLGTDHYEMIPELLAGP